MRLSPLLRTFWLLKNITLMVNLQDFVLQKHADCSLKAMLLTKKSMKNKPLMVIVDRNVLVHRNI